MKYTKLSKEISYALRHVPWGYELELDAEGFVPVEQLLSAINEDNRYGRPVTVADLEHIITTAEKKRHEIRGDKIRALYGHSVPGHISRQQITPPAVLYHGTTHKALAAIMKDGLKPMVRQYVHLSVDIDTARRVGQRRDSNPVILVINAAKANADGIPFYEGNEKVILADTVPAKYLHEQELTI